MSEPELTLYQRMISASAGAVLTSLFVTPLDVVKVRLQTQGHNLVSGRCFLYSNGLMDHLCTFCAQPSPTRTPGPGPSFFQAASCEWYARPSRPSPFTGTFDGILKIARSEGVTSLWSGLSPTLVIAMPATVGYFTLNDHLCERWKRRFGDRFWVPMIAGSTARSAVVVITNPVEMIRTKLQSEKLSYRDIGRALRETQAVEGWAVWWKGLTSTLARDVLFTAVYWGLLDYGRGRLMAWEGREATNFRISFTAGAASGLVAAALTNPFDVVKTQRQIRLGESGFRNGRQGTRALLQELFRDKGWRSLYAGLTPRMMKVVPACAIMIGCYDYGKAAFRKRNAAR